MARAFDHHLDVMALRDRFELRQAFPARRIARGVIGVADRPDGAVAKRERNVIAVQQLADILEMGVEEILLVMREAPLGENRTAARHDAGDTVGREMDVAPGARRHGW